MTAIINSTVTLETETCCACGTTFAMELSLKNGLMNDPNKSFYCPNGHSMHYKSSKEQRLRHEAEQRLRQAENQLAQERAKAAQLETQLKTEQRKMNRVKNGVCPCCNRTFKNLGRHMAHKHPEVKKK